MQPYYQDDYVTIYHGDCRAHLADTGPIAVGILDPPYGYSFSSNRSSSRTGWVMQGDNGTRLRDSVLEWFGDVAWACFGSWKVPPPSQAKTALCWDKGPASGMGDLSIPWKSSWEIIWIGGTGWSGFRDEGVLRGHRIVTWESRGRFHVTQKPESLMAALLIKAPAGTVLDPFMGSGTTLRAAKDLGRRAIGIEIEERYCELAAQRCSQEVLAL